MKLPSSAKFLLFDMDGTLVDTEPIGPQTFVAQLKKYGVTPTADEQTLFSKIWRRDGTAIKQDSWLPETARKYGIDQTPKTYLQEFYDLYVKAIVMALPLPGADNFLRTAKASGRFKTALVTASRADQVAAILSHQDWKDMFDAVVTSEDFTKHKPNPEPFRVAMQKLGASSNHSIVFEDSKNGALAGALADCYVIGLRAGNAKPQDLDGANQIVDNFSNVSL